MIHYLVAARHAYPMRAFLDSWGAALAPRIAIVTYEGLLSGDQRLPEHGGSYIFTSLNSLARMEAPTRTAITDLHAKLVETRGAAKVLNDPSRTLLRYDFLRAMHDQGINRFNVFSAREPDVPMRFPVFLRGAAGSEQTAPRLLHNKAEYDATIRGLRWQRGSVADMIAVEFRDTADTHGVHRKYGAFVVGDRVVPRHLFFSRNWMVKLADLAEPDLLAEERAYVETNPHAEAVRDCARRAHVSYGRVDYAVLDGAPQFWEINSNAGLVTAPADDVRGRGPVHATFAAMFADALAAIDDESST
jgi:hypothetical protein